MDDPLSQLPLECLQHILQTLDNDNTPFALANLLTMNKYIASVTLPFLCCDPFRRQYHAYLKGRLRNRWSPGMYTMSSRETLYRMLLSRPSVANRLPTALSLALTVNSSNNSNENILPKTSTTTTATTSSPLSYLAHIHHLSIIIDETLTLLDWTGFELPEELPSRLLKCLGSIEFDQIYRLNPFKPEMVAAYSESKPKKVILYCYYHFKVDQEVL
ncbi:hypothetical protein BGZ47_001098 [Haplosporangium gracile]|nr:hypothetical protein BGZ47_001098 [Haplosporangium gracile]